MKSAFKSMRIEYHILQSFPVTCLNRDDVGAPKTAIVGGSTRARVSSQCWKRQVRLTMAELGVKLGTRTKKVAKHIATACLDAGANEESALACGEKIAKEFSDDTLLFFSDKEAEAFAEHARKFDFQPDEIKANDLKKLSKKVVNKNLDALDIALFGRMVAKAPDMNIEAACSFSHAISTHKVSNEIEFFTAVDDLQDEPGSAHMGSLEFNSATYYRYISLDIGQLAQTLGNEDLKKAVEVFTKALYIAVPGARQATQSGACPWEFAKVLVRKGQRIQVPFETPVKAQAGGYLAPSVTHLKTYIDKKEQLSGSVYGKIGDYEWGEDETFNLDNLIQSLQTHIS
jgi:CRISPR system Cascade subunit CasC